MAYKSITVVKGSGGYGGPLSITQQTRNINLSISQVAVKTRNC